MTVYVDDMFIEHKGRLWCHLISDDLNELHAFAADLGLERKHCHNGDHYDVTEWMRSKAVRKGAIQVSAKFGVLVRKQLRKSAKP